MITLSQLRQLTIFTLCLLMFASGASIAPAQEKGGINLAHIPEDAFAAVVINPQKLLADPSLELLPFEVIEAAGKQALGINPLEIEQAIGFFAPPEPGMPPDWGLVLHFSKPQKLAGEVLRETEPAKINKVNYLAGLDPFSPSFCLYQEKTLLIGAEATLRSMITIKAGKSPLRTLLAATELDADITAIAAIEPVRPLLNQVLTMAPPLPPRAQPLLSIPDHLDSVQVELNFISGRPTGVTLTGKDAAAAKKLETILTEALEFGKLMFLAEMNRGGAQQPDDPVQQAQIKYTGRLANAIVQKLTPVRNGNNVTIAVDSNPGIAASSAIVAALLLPAVQQAREAARRTVSRNNLKRIGIAMHNYHDVFQNFPAQANYEKKKPLLSWRVHILPYLDVAAVGGGNALYKEFHLDEPWDSPHNKKLIERMPAVYKNPNSNPKEFKTNYLVVSGEDTLFPGEDQLAVRDVIDGTSNTVMTVEADKAVIWTKPDDWEYDEKNPGKGLGTYRTGGFLAGFADGSVKFISIHVDPDILRAVFTPAGGEAVRIPF